MGVGSAAGGLQGGREWTHQQLGGAQLVQLHGLDAGDVDAHLPVDPGALDAGQDAQVSGQPLGV